MPRERLHWEVLNSAVRELPTDSVVRSILLKNPNAAALGAIVHDSFYYHRFGRSQFEWVSDFLHGDDGKDTFDPIREMLRAIAASKSTPDAERAAQIAFVLGMISHAVTDAVFHPLVYAVTGNYHAKDLAARDLAQGRHRIFEVWLDSWTREYRRLPRRLPRIASYRRELQSSLSEILKPLSGLNQWNGVVLPWDEAIYDHGRIQRLAVSPRFGFLLRLLGSLVSGWMFSTEALSSYRRYSAPRVFFGEFRVRHPVTGVPLQIELPTLLDRAIRECVRIFSSLEDFAKQGTLGAFEREMGASLNFGMVGVDIGKARFFDPIWDLIFPGHS